MDMPIEISLFRVIALILFVTSMVLALISLKTKQRVLISIGLLCNFVGIILLACSKP
jgi:NADH:ubiquinone oxidoreductase subunit K